MILAYGLDVSELSPFPALRFCISLVAERGRRKIPRVNTAARTRTVIRAASPHAARGRAELDIARGARNDPECAQHDSPAKDRFCRTFFHVSPIPIGPADRRRPLAGAAAQPRKILAARRRAPR